VNGSLYAGNQQRNSSFGRFTFSDLSAGNYELNLTGVPNAYLPPVSAQVVQGENVLNLTVYPLAVFHLIDTPNLAFNGTQPGPIINVKNGTAVRIDISNNTTQVFSLAIVRNLYDITTDNVLFGSLSNTISAGGSVNNTFVASKSGTFYYQSMTGNQAREGEYGYFTVTP